MRPPRCVMVVTILRFARIVSSSLGIGITGAAGGGAGILGVENKDVIYYSTVIINPYELYTIY